jgi:hypothetical protein
VSGRGFGTALAAALLLLGGCGESSRDAAAPPATTTSTTPPTTTTTTIAAAAHPDPDACALMSQAEVRLIAHQSVSAPKLRPFEVGEGSECTWVLPDEPKLSRRALALAVRRWPDPAAARKALEEFRASLPPGAATPVGNVGDEATWVAMAEDAPNQVKSLFAVWGAYTIKVYAPSRPQAISLGLLTVSRLVSGSRPGAKPGGRQ